VIIKNKSIKIKSVGLGPKVSNVVN